MPPTDPMVVLERQPCEKNKEGEKKEKEAEEEGKGKANTYSSDERKTGLVISTVDHIQAVQQLPRVHI